jgi:Response regulators consisting of a CheY-like receiver domain and a winged-helix DNA-binding domain
MLNILIVEDDLNTRRLMETILKRAGYFTYTASNGEEALDLIAIQHLDLMIVDLMMPLMDGYELTESLRDAGYDIPILMVSAKQLPEDRKKGFLVGTDDYMIKPVDEEEMLLRIKALLRRSNISNHHKLKIGTVVLDYDALTISKNNEEILLPKKEFYLLYKLLSYPNKIFTRIQLMDEIWGYDTETMDYTVNVHINRLRKKFDDYPEFEIITIRGLGYKAVINHE